MTQVFPNGVVGRGRLRVGDMVYVGDNPAKDFVSLTPLGVLTVRVLTGSHSETRAHSGHDALFAMPDLDALPGVLAMRFPESAPDVG